MCATAVTCQMEEIWGQTFRYCDLSCRICMSLMNAIFIFGGARTEISVEPQGTVWFTQAFGLAWIALCSSVLQELPG